MALSQAPRSAGGSPARQIASLHVVTHYSLCTRAACHYEKRRGKDLNLQGIAADQGISAVAAVTIRLAASEVSAHRQHRQGHDNEGQVQDDLRLQEPFIGESSGQRRTQKGGQAGTDAEIGDFVHGCQFLGTRRTNSSLAHKRPGVCVVRRILFILLVKRPTAGARSLGRAPSASQTEADCARRGCSSPAARTHRPPVATGRHRCACSA